MYFGSHWKLGDRGDDQKVRTNLKQKATRQGNTRQGKANICVVMACISLESSSGDMMSAYMEMVPCVIIFVISYPELLSPLAEI